MPAGDPDILWAHFLPLWRAIPAPSQPVLIGGYALALKRRWLAAPGGPPTLLPSAAWGPPRATTDMDFVLRAEILLDLERNREIRAVLAAHGWLESDRQGGRNWQFVRSIGAGQKIKVEFQTAVPIPPGTAPYKQQSRRVGLKQSLGESGIHAFPNPEAVAIHATPFDLADEGHPSVRVRVPHPLNMALMKLKAMADERQKAEQAAAHDKDRHDRQAFKHAGDVALAIAMMTREETDSSPAILEGLRVQPVFQAIQMIARRHFLEETGWGRRAVPTALTPVFDTLESWFA